MIRNFLSNKTKVLQCKLNFNFSNQTPPNFALQLLLYCIEHKLLLGLGLEYTEVTL
jgi:hypothetical protein